MQLRRQIQGNLCSPLRRQGWPLRGMHQEVGYCIEGPFRSGWEAAIEEAGAYIDSMAGDGRDTMQTLMEQVVGLMNGSYVLMETPSGPLGIVKST